MDDGGLKPAITLRKPSKREDSVIEDMVKNTCPHTHKTDHALVKPERVSGNRVAVRKYREKKKAQNAYLEEEVRKLRLVNRALVRRLQVQDALGAEAARLRRLLVDFKSRIGDELAVSRVYKQSFNGSFDGCIHRA